MNNEITIYYTLNEIKEELDYMIKNKYPEDILLDCFCTLDYCLEQLQEIKQVLNKNKD